MAAVPLPQSLRIVLNNTLGAAFLGHFVTTILYGITTLQAFIYYRDQYNDPIVLKLSVAGIWILDTVHVVLITGAMYWYCISNFTNLAAIQKPIWPISAMIIVSNLSNVIVRGFFMHRLYKLGNKSLFLPGLIALFSLFIFADALYFAIELMSISSYLDISNFSWGLYAGLSVEVAADLLVAISQCILLQGFQTGIRTTDSVIMTLMTYSVNTGLLTSLCAVGALIAYAAAPMKFIYFAFYFILSKLYVNSLLATLNARGSLLSKTGRRRRRSKLRVTTRTATADAGHDASIEFTTVISADALSTDSVMETTKTKVGDESLSVRYSG